MEQAIVLYPSPGMGHLISMVELGKLIIKTNPSLCIKILVFTRPHATGSTSKYIASASNASPSIAFHHLPTIALPQSFSSLKLEELNFELPALNNPNLLQALQTISSTSQLRAFVLDFFNDAAFQVTRQLNIPTFYFFTAAATSLCHFLYFRTMHHSYQNEDPNGLLEVPGIPPFPPSDLPPVVQVRDSKIYNRFLDGSNLMRESEGIIVNTFESLETRAVKALSDGLCVPDAKTPPIFCVGPLIASNEHNNSIDSDEHERLIMCWLNTQPSKSVVFLCFGSLGLFSAKQLTDMAIGLEKSGHRFLWVVRNPPPTEYTNRSPTVEAAEPTLDEILPDGFIERTKDRGLVVKSWAPQVAVLKHESVGGFVTHCGWNSILEAVCGGVPMVAWPLYAEQKLNRVFLVDEAKLALRLKESEDGFVSSDELEKRVRELMDSEIGKEMRNRVMKMRDEAIAAMETGGSSRWALARLTKSWTNVSIG